MKRLCVCLFLLVTWSIAGNGQIRIEDVTVREFNNRIQVKLQLSGECRHEIIPFNSKWYTLVKLMPLQFSAGVKDRTREQLEKLSVKIQALELSEPAVMFAFKGVLANQLSVRRSGAGLVILVDKHPSVTGDTRISPVKKARNYYEKALRFYEKKNYSVAINAIHQALRYRPQYAEAYFLAGKIRFERQEWRKAKINFRKALRMNPSVGDADSYLAAIRERMNPKAISPFAGEKELATPPPQEVAKPQITATADSAVHQSGQTSVDSARIVITRKPGSESGNRPQATRNPVAGVETQTGSIARFVLQTGLLLMILSFAFGWPIVLWLKRHELAGQRRKGRQTQETEKSPADGGSFLQELRKRTGADKLSEPARSERQEDLNRSRIESGVRKPAAEDASGFFLRLRRAPFVPGKPSDQEKEILRLASAGFSVEEIAERLRLGRVEVQLVLNLQGKQVPMSSPELRIEMAE